MLENCRDELYCGKLGNSFKHCLFSGFAKTFSFSLKPWDFFLLFLTHSTLFIICIDCTKLSKLSKI